VAGTHYYTVTGQLATKRETQSHLNVHANGRKSASVAQGERARV